MEANQQRISWYCGVKGNIEHLDQTIHIEELVVSEIVLMEQNQTNKKKTLQHQERLVRLNRESGYWCGSIRIKLIFQLNCNKVGSNSPAC